MRTFIPPMMMIMTLFLATTFWVAESKPNTKIKTIFCNKQNYSNDDPFGKSVAYVLSDLTNVTPSQKGYNYYTVYTTSPYPKSVAYGHATCRQSLAYSECANCLAAAKSTVSSSCSGSIGGQVTMVDCSMRYEKYSFT